MALLSRTELLKTLVWFCAVNDAELLEQDHILTTDLCAPEDRQVIRGIARTLHALTVAFDYLRSPEFEDAIKGKSSAYATMKAKLEGAPVHRVEQLKRLHAALSDLLSSDEAYRLLRPRYYADLDEIRDVMTRLRNPEQ